MSGGAPDRAGAPWLPASPAGGACEPGRPCITCSDEGVPMRVVEAGAEEGLAVCEDGEGRRDDVLTALVGPVAAGDLLLVHAGTALVRLPPGEEGA